MPDTKQKEERKFFGSKEFIEAVKKRKKELEKLRKQLNAEG